MEDKTLNQQLAEDAKESDALSPGRMSSGPLPGDATEGRTANTNPISGQGDDRKAEMQAEMEAREAAVGQRGVGVIGDVHLGTPAGGVTDAAQTGHTHYGTARDEQED